MGVAPVEDCVASILDNGGESVRVTVLENHPPGDPPQIQGVRRINLGEDLLWVRAANAGLSLSTAPHVVLMNDDTRVETEDWLVKMRRHFGSQTAAVYPKGAQESFWCSMLSRQALFDVGLLDLRFADGYGGDDTDWCHRARVAGYEIIEAGDVLVHHEGGATFKESRHHGHPDRSRNLDLFRDKWPEINIW